MARIAKTPRPWMADLRTTTLGSSGASGAGSGGGSAKGFGVRRLRRLAGASTRSRIVPLHCRVHGALSCEKRGASKVRAETEAEREPAVERGGRGARVVVP